MTAYSIPSLVTIGLLFASGIAALGAAAWFIITGDADYEIMSFPPLLGGMILLVIAAVLFALRLINQRHGTTPPQP
jgi:hypothetical protein